MPVTPVVPTREVYEPDRRFWGIIVKNGPQGQSDLTNASYWVVTSYIANDETDPPTDLLDVNRLQSGDPAYCVLRVTNLAEKSNNSHLIPPETIVRFTCDFDDGDPAQLRYWMNFAVPGSFSVMLTQDGGSAGSATTFCSFTYTVKTLSGTTIGTQIGIPTNSSGGGGGVRIVPCVMAAGNRGIAHYENASGNVNLILDFANESNAGFQCTGT
jgi:hypothetical protein